VNGSASETLFLNALCDYRYLNKSFNFNNVDPEPDPAFNFNLLLIKVMGNYEHWSIDPPGLNFERPRPLTALEPLKLLKFDCNGDPDPAFHSYADPDPASKHNADPAPQPNLHTTTTGTLNNS
jgi:hypothetical protein